MDYESLKAGPELNALVAEKILGCRLKRVPIRNPRYNKSETFGCGCPAAIHDDQRDFPEPLKMYSEDISAAWEVMGFLQARFDVDLYWHGDLWRCGVTYQRGIVGEGETAPLAICRVALEVSDRLKATATPS